MNYGIYIVTYLIIPIIVLGSIRIKPDSSFILEQKTTDSIKGILVLLVVLSHMASNVEGPFIFQFLFGQFGMYCVAIFFLLSGYGCTISYLKRESFKGYWKKKIIKLYIPFVAVNCISLIIAYCQGIRYTFFETILYILGIYLRDTTLWFIQTIFIFYLIFYLGMRFFYKDRLLFILITTVMYIVIGYIGGGGVWQFNTSLMFFVGFLYATKESLLGEFFKKYYFSIIGISSLLFLVIKFISMKFYSGLNEIIFGNISTIFFGIIFICIISKVRINSKVLMFFKRYSYEIYLLHMKVMLLVNFNNPVRIIEICFYFGMLLIASIALNRVLRIKAN